MVVSARSPGTVSTVTVPILVTRELLVTIVSLRYFLISDYAFTSDLISSAQNKTNKPNQNKEHLNLSFIKYFQ